MKQLLYSQGSKEKERNPTCHRLDKSAQRCWPQVGMFCPLLFPLQWHSLVRRESWTGSTKGREGCFSLCHHKWGLLTLPDFWTADHTATGFCALWFLALPFSGLRFISVTFLLGKQKCSTSGINVEGVLRVVRVEFILPSQACSV